MNRRLLPVLLLSLTPLVQANNVDTSLTPERLWDLVRLGAYAVSPDDRTVAATATSFDVQSDKSSSQLWIFDIQSQRGARLLRTGLDSNGKPAWHPDGRTLFFLGNMAGKPAQIYRQPITGGSPVALTSLPIAITDFRIVEEGRTVIFEAATWPDLDADFERVKARLDENDADKTQAKISETRILRYWDHYLTDGRVPHLFRLDVVTGAIVDLLADFDRITGFDGFEWDVTPDGKTIAYSANSTPSPYRDLNFDIYLRDLAKGSEHNLTGDNPADDVRPVFAPDGRQLAYGRYRRPGIASDFRQLAILDLADKRTTVIDARTSHVGDWQFDRSQRGIYFHADDAGQTHLYHWRDQRIHRLARGGTTESVRTAGRGIVYARHDFRHPADLWYLEPGQSPRRFTAFNDSRVRPRDFGRYESVEFTGAEGKTVQMFVVRPKQNRQTGARRPAVILNHGGPFSAWTDSFSYRWHPELLAAKGYVVALPNFHGSTGFGQPFADSILGNHGEKPAADTLAAADWLIEHANVDPERIALAGGSYGGYLTALLTGMTDRFKAAIVHAGVYDIGQQFASDSQWTRPSAYGDAPWTDPVRLGQWSPSRFVPRMNTPTLIMHGEMDYRVPVTQGINLHGALTGKGVPTRIVIFPKEHHWIVRPRAAQLWWREMFAWLARWSPAEASDAIVMERQP